MTENSLCAQLGIPVGHSDLDQESLGQRCLVRGHVRVHCLHLKHVFYRDSGSIARRHQRLVPGTSEYYLTQEMLHHNAGQVGSVSTRHLGAEPGGHVALTRLKLGHQCALPWSLLPPPGAIICFPKII